MVFYGGKEQRSIAAGGDGSSLIPIFLRNNITGSFTNRILDFFGFFYGKKEDRNIAAGGDGPSLIPLFLKNNITGSFTNRIYVLRLFLRRKGAKEYRRWRRWVFPYSYIP